MIVKLSLVAFLMTGQFCILQAQQERTAASVGLTNSDVVRMVEAGLSEEIVIAAIRAQKGTFDVGPEALISLKEQGISDRVLAEMVRSLEGRSDAPQRPQGEVLLADGTEIRLRLMKTISSATARVGDVVPLEASEQVTADGVVVIDKGALARGEVFEAKKKRSFGRRGHLDFTIDVVKAVDDQNIRLRATREMQGDDSYGKAGVVTLLTGPFGWFVKGKDVEISAGTEFTIYIDGDRTIRLKQNSDRSE